MWDLNLRKEILEKTDGLDERASKKILARYGVSWSTLRYWRRCIRDGNPTGYYGNTNAHIVKVVKREIKKHEERCH